MPAWRNWSGSVECSPRRIESPASEADVVALVEDTRARGGTLRAIGAGHTASDLVRCDDVLLCTRALEGLVSVDRPSLRATVRAGATLEDLGEALHAHDLAFPNYGDVATQTVGGALATGTHGAGVRQPALAQALVGGRLVTGTGDVRVFDESDPGFLRAARISLGALGVFTEMTLQLVPAFDVERREYAMRTDDLLACWEELRAANMSCDFYWYPRRDDAKLRLVNPVGGGSGDPPGSRLLELRGGYSHQLIPTHSGIPHRFEECEYALPADAARDCFAAVRRRILERWRASVGWRVLYRPVAADDTWLGPASGCATETISLHQNASLPWQAFFADIEPIFRDHGGRPHWAKKHGMTADGLAPRYPKWKAFGDLRRRLDPDGVFLTPWLATLLGEAA